MTSPMSQHIPLKSAYLCQDCDCVGNSATRCPACASASLLGLSCVLNREEARVDFAATTFMYSPSRTAVLAA
jgi:hypothetical protein